MHMVDDISTIPGIKIMPGKFDTVTLKAARLEAVAEAIGEECTRLKLAAFAHMGDPASALPLAEAFDRLCELQWFAAHGRGMRI